MVIPAIKICGISTPEALDAAIRNRAEYAGFNFFPPSPRFVTIRDLPVLAERASGRISSVGVFVDPDDGMLSESVTAGRLGAIQLHGKETPERTAQVKAQFGLPVWKVLSVSSASDIERAASYEGAADFLLFDAKTPKGTLPGGMGLSFDWSLLSAYRGSTPWGLAGGLTPDNVAQAIRSTGAPLVDTSSGVESAAGIKDVDRIAAFCQSARSI
ncbi:phosphoribosylanthranilate isomerase [Altericroceibacterium endophyticum]|uniref:N-(5'-phosphoribosyl)anthranilate isomerase n=1 Tax=Altericroceibacterium endophyticum TaxID=1808508 RepID=A0A6I4T2M1_9SPHN|nr:phosphoribosylanthranilate isomerase [Altericroceibacterium endophyticum]MXO64389.1 phosphoribosylanthranilate isomerase [Altericroceibacterium endophyticum]